MKRVNVGGQAVIEGVMMKYENRYTVAVRKPNHDIIMDHKEYNSVSDRIKFLKWPLLRGIVAFVESMIIGVRTLTYSAEFFEVEEEETPTKLDLFLQKIFGEKTEDILVGVSVFLSIVLGIGLFMLAPLFLARFLRNYIPNYTVLSIVEGVIRIGLFLGYITLISKMKDIQRVFQYHGAEHKTINCLEHEEPLTVENVMKHSRLHKRCGTSFLLIVMMVSIFVFMFVRVDALWLRAVSRIVLVPVIAGLSYEVIRFAGKSEAKWVNVVSFPGLCLQKLTTKEPDSAQIEVAIAAVKGVLEDGSNPTTNVL